MYIDLIPRKYGRRKKGKKKIEWKRRRGRGGEGGEDSLLDKKQKRPDLSYPSPPDTGHQEALRLQRAPGTHGGWRGSVLNWHPHPIRYIADSVQFCAFWPYLQIWYLIQSVLQTGRQKYSQWIPKETMLRPWIKNCWDYQIWMNPLSDTFQRRNYCMVWSLSTKSLLLIWHVAITIGMVALSRYRAAVLFARAAIVQALSA